MWNLTRDTNRINSNFPDKIGINIPALVLKGKISNNKLRILINMKSVIQYFNRLKM